MSQSVQYHVGSGPGIQLSCVIQMILLLVSYHVVINTLSTYEHLTIDKKNNNISI